MTNITKNYVAPTPPRRVLAIHDLSSFGRCALSVVIPTLSALGIQTVALPTALMSTHTGGYSDIHIRDLSSDMVGMYSHWKKLGVRFDSVYSGFVLNAEQGGIIAEVIDAFKSEDTLVLVDPVLGDDGEYYSTCTPDLREVMISLCSRAHLITPNLTEACILSDTPYPELLSSRSEAESLARTLAEKLAPLCPTLVITGIHYAEDGKLFVMNLSRDESGNYSAHVNEQVGCSYPGTGELFASVLLGLMLDGMPFFEASKYAAVFVKETIESSVNVIEEARHGTALEPALMRLSHDLYKKLAK